jgi:hypothetical protein
MGRKIPALNVAQKQRNILKSRVANLQTKLAEAQNTLDLQKTIERAQQELELKQKAKKAKSVPEGIEEKKVGSTESSSTNSYAFLAFLACFVGVFAFAIHKGVQTTKTKKTGSGDVFPGVLLVGSAVTGLLLLLLVAVNKFLFTSLLCSQPSSTSEFPFFFVGMMSAIGALFATTIYKASRMVKAPRDDSEDVLLGILMITVASGGILFWLMTGYHRFFSEC